MFLSFHSVAEEKQDERLLDETSMNHFYQNGNAVCAEFDDEQIKYKWIACPMKMPRCRRNIVQEK